MAISPGFVQNNVYFDKIRAEYSNEPTILENSEARTAFDVNAGLTYSFNSFETSFSVFQLSENKFKYENQFDLKDLTFRLIRHYYLTSKYTFQLNQNIELSPIVNIRSVQGITPQYDIYTVIKWNNTFWGAVGYRGNYGVSFSIGGFVLDNLNFTYSYDLAIGNIALLSGGSHEISIGYVFGERKKNIKEPYFTPVTDYQQIPYEKIEHYEIVQQENDGLKEQLNNNKKELLKQKGEIQRLNSLLEQNKANLDEIMKKFMVNIEDELPEEVENKLEEKAYHVIVGAYFKLEDAKFFQKILQRELSLDTRVYEREDGKYFFVYTTTVADKNELSKEVKRLKKINISEYINGNIWIAK